MPFITSYEHISNTAFLFLMKCRYKKEYRILHNSLVLPPIKK